MAIPVSPRLAALLSPLHLSVFFAEYWEQRPLVIPGAPAKFADLLTVEDIDQLVSAGHLRYPEIRLARATDSPRPNEFTHPDGRLDPVAALKLFAAGTTLILDRLDDRLPSLGALCRELDAQLAMSFQTNVYVTPPNSRGFKVHYDTHDVFVLQVEGSKTWELFGSTVRLPLRGQGHETCVDGPGEVVERFTLNVGDVAYVPRGCFHQAVAGDALSVHITLGASVRTWADLLIEAVSEACLRDVELRRGLPPGFGLPDFDDTEARDVFERLRARLAGTLAFKAAAVSCARDFARTRVGAAPGQLVQVLRIDEVGAEAILVRRSSLVWLAEREDDRYVVSALNAEIDFPASAADTVAAFLSGVPVRVADAPGPLDVAGKVVIARRLVLEGLVERKGRSEQVHRSCRGALIDAKEPAR